MPLVAKKMFPNYVWDIATNAKEIYLTFDDGPTPEITPWTLDVLNQYQAKATFFCIGSNAAKHPDIFKRLLKEGHSLGNHTHNHLKGWKSTTEDYLKNIAEAEAIFTSQISQATPSQDLKNTKLFRPPYGQIRRKQGKALMGLGYKIIMWDVLSFDWDKDVTQETCLNNVISKTVNGSIVVFHDSVKASKNMQYALPRVLDYFSKKGFQFKGID